MKQTNECQDFGEIHESNRVKIVTSCMKTFVEQRHFLFRSKTNEIELQNMKAARNGSGRYLLRYQGEANQRIKVFTARTFEKD